MPGFTPVVPAPGQAPPGDTWEDAAGEDAFGDADAEDDDMTGEVAVGFEADDGGNVRAEVLAVGVVAIECVCSLAALGAAECESQPAPATIQRSAITTAVPRD